MQVTVEVTERSLESTERHVGVGAAVEAALDTQRHVAVLAPTELDEREVPRRRVRTVAASAVAPVGGGRPGR